MNNMSKCFLLIIIVVIITSCQSNKENTDTTTQTNETLNNNTNKSNDNEDLELGDEDKDKTNEKDNTTTEGNTSTTENSNKDKVVDKDILEYLAKEKENGINNIEEFKNKINELNIGDDINLDYNNLEEDSNTNYDDLYFLINKVLNINNYNDPINSNYIYKKTLYEPMVIEIKTNSNYDSTLEFSTDLYSDPNKFFITAINKSADYKLEDNADEELQFINKYIKALKEKDADRILELSFPFEYENNLNNNTLLNEINKLIEQYHANYDMDSLQLYKTIYTRDTKYSSHRIFEFILIGKDKDGKILKHSVFRTLTIIEYVYDHWDDSINTSSIVKDEVDPVRKDIEIGPYESIYKKINGEDVYKKELNDGTEVSIYEDDKIVLKDDSKQKTILIPEDIIYVDISYDGEKLAYTNERGLYISDLNFQNSELKLASTDYAQCQNVKWSKDDSKILFDLYGYDCFEGAALFNLNKNEVEWFLNYEYYFYNWIEDKSIIILNYGWPDEEKLIYDYKNNNIYFE
ncbi:MAG: hypothetical protein ACOCRK_07785 [bacterium]